MNLDRELQVARLAASEAAQIHLEHLHGLKEIEIKSDTSPVTQVDKASEKKVLEHLEKAFPDDGFLGEETGLQEGRSGRTWIIDPLDGTRPYIRGIPTFSILIGLEVESESVLGVMHFPAMNQVCWATQGQGAFLDGQAIHVSKETEFKQVVASGLGYLEEQGTPKGDALNALLKQCGYVYGFMDAYSYLQVARGGLDFVANLYDQPWDCAAGACIVKEAGGKFSSIDGENSLHKSSSLFSNGLLHASVLEAMQQK